MMALCPFAVLKLLPENSTQKHTDPDQAILHSAVDQPGPTSLYGYFKQDAITLESTFFIKNDGTIEQYMDTNVQADANRYANPRAISIETEDDGDPNNTPWNVMQVEAILRLLKWICVTHPKVLRRQCPAWDQAGIGWHSMWGAPSPWTPAAGKTCPGTIRIPQARDIIAAVAAPDVEEDDMFSDFDRKTLQDAAAVGVNTEFRVATLEAQIAALEAKIGTPSSGTLAGTATINLEVR